MGHHFDHRHQTLSRLQQRLETGYLPGYGNAKDKFYRCDVVFGSPSADCRGTGICKIVAGAGTGAELRDANSDCKRTPAIFGFNAASERLSLLLFPELLCTRILHHHLRQGILEMPEACALPADLRQFFGLSSRQIQFGTYPIDQKMGYYQIDFGLKAGDRKPRLMQHC